MSTDDGHTRLEMTVRRGMPLSMASYLMRAVGAAYPGTMIDTTTARTGPTLALLVPDSDLYEPADIPDAALRGLASEKNLADVEAFTSGFADGAIGLRPPEWLTELLLTTARQMVDAMDAENYVAIDMLPQDGSDPFVWIVCRPGRPSPHALRQAAEAERDTLRKALLEVIAVADDVWDDESASRQFALEKVQRIAEAAVSS